MTPAPLRARKAPKAPKAKSECEATATCESSAGSVSFFSSSGDGEGVAWAAIEPDGEPKAVFFGDEGEGVTVTGIGGPAWTEKGEASGDVRVFGLGGGGDPEQCRNQ